MLPDPQRRGVGGEHRRPVRCAANVWLTQSRDDDRDGQVTVAGPSFVPAWLAVAACEAILARARARAGEGVPAAATLSGVACTELPHVAAA